MLFTDFNLLFSACKTGSENLAKVMNTDITPVVDAYIHGLLGRFPRARYVLGKGATIPLLVQALPEWLGDLVFAGMFSGASKPAICR